MLADCSVPVSLGRLPISRNHVADQPEPYISQVGWQVGLHCGCDPAAMAAGEADGDVSPIRRPDMAQRRAPKTADQLPARPGPHCQTGSALAGDGELAGVAGQAQSPVGHGTFQRGFVTCAPWAAPAGRGCSTSGGTTGKPASRQAANPPSRSVAFRKPSRCRAAAARLD
jgi:hypothetical protein